MRVIIVGGVAGGATCATRLRRLREDIEIVIYEKTNYVSYANCGLPYYLGGVITDKNKLTLQSPKSFKERFNVDVNVNHEVLSIDTNNKEVLVKNLINGEVFKDKYDKLLLATGAKAKIPDLEGKELAYTLKNVEDTFNLSTKLKKANEVVVVGAGFIGLELVENLIHLGKKVVLVERLDQVLSPIDREMAAFLEHELEKNGVSVKLNINLLSLEKTNNKIVVNLDNEVFQTDMVIFALGVSPNDILARNSGLEVSPKGGILVNDYLQTSNEDIYACGDVILTKNIIDNQLYLSNLAGPANKQARIVANNICGYKQKYLGNIGSSIIKIFNLNCAFVGLNEKKLQNLNIKYNKIYLSPNDHASYYPGSQALTIKILYSDNYNILGAQVIGESGVDKTIDILALAIYSKINLLDLENVDFAYAPPFNSAKTPINIAGYIASNLKLGLVKQYDIFMVNELILKKAGIFLDVRTNSEYNSGHIKEYINIPLDNLHANLAKLDKNKDIYVMCQSALRSYLACRILTNNGFSCYNLAGGYRLYANYYLNRTPNLIVLSDGKEKI